MKIQRVDLAATAVGFLVVGTLLGWAARDKTFEPQVIIQTQNVTQYIDRVEYRDKEVPVIEYREKLVELQVPFTVIEYIDKIVFRDIYRYTTDFQSLEEFQKFVEPIGIVIVWDGKCYDAALYYWQRAYEQGKRVYMDAVEPYIYNQYFQKRKLDIYGDNHMVVSVAIGRKLYWLDPATAEIVFHSTLAK